MAYINTLKKVQLKESTIAEAAGVVTFSVNDDKLDTMLNSRFSNQLDFVNHMGDTYYTLPKAAFDRLIDLADSSGFDVDYENSENSVIDLLDVNEISTSGSAGGYETPNAFGKLSDDNIEMLGYKKVKKVQKESVKNKESQFMSMSKEMFLNEISYGQYKKDPIASPKQKINYSINFINRGLREIEKVVNQNVRLKQEMKIENGAYLKSSRENLIKISERLARVSKQLKELAS